MKIAVVGLGLIGGSILKALGERTDHYLMGIDIDKDTLDQVQSLGLTQETADHGREILPKADVVFICLYPKAIPQFLTDYQASFKDGAILTDVASFKADLVTEAEKVMPSQVDFVFAHPMRGSEIPGFVASKSDLFDGANVLIIPRDYNYAESLALVEALYRKMGATNINHMSAQDHDYKIAYVSHLAHVIAVAYTNSTHLPAGEVRDVAGSSYLDLTRVAKINGELWADIFFNNKKELLTTIEEFQGQLAEVKQALETDNEDRLLEMFDQSRDRQNFIQ